MNELSPEIIAYLQSILGGNNLGQAYNNAMFTQLGRSEFNNYPQQNFNTSQNTVPVNTTVQNSTIPQAVLNEPVADWEKDQLTYGDNTYEVVNGQWQLSNATESKTGVAPWAGESENVQLPANKINWDNLAPLLNPLGTSMQTDFYNFGRFLGMDPNTPGRGIGAVGAGISSVLGAARTGLSGYSNSVATRRVQEDAREKMQRRLYSPQTQYRNTNYLGNGNGNG